MRGNPAALAKPPMESLITVPSPEPSPETPPVSVSHPKRVVIASQITPTGKCDIRQINRPKKNPYWLCSKGCVTWASGLPAALQHLQHLHYIGIIFMSQ